MKVLVTGNRGMVGRNIINVLRKNDLSVVAPSRQEMDLEDFCSCKKVLKDQKPDFVIHSAGKVGGIQANKESNQVFLLKNNIIGMNIINASLEAGVNNLINIGSSCMYPKDIMRPIKEEDLLSGNLEPTNEGYAIAKVATAKLCEFSSKEYGVYYKTVIPPNLYGYYDHFEPERSHLIASVISKIDSAIREKSEIVTIWGDGGARREFMFVDDLAQFVSFVLDKIHLIPHYLNVGLGYDYSVEEYYRMVAHLLGYEGDFQFDISKPVGMKKKLLDCSRMRELGWEPQTGIEEGILKTYSYYKHQLG